MRLPLLPETEKEIARLWDSHHTVREISAELGVPFASVAESVFERIRDAGDAERARLAEMRLPAEDQ